jgi:predicted transcriptional regulator
VIERAAAQEGALKALVARLFKGSSDALLLHLVSREKLSAKQVQRIEEQLRKASRKEKP